MKYFVAILIVGLALTPLVHAEYDDTDVFMSSGMDDEDVDIIIAVLASGEYEKRPEKELENIRFTAVFYGEVDLIKFLLSKGEKVEDLIPSASRSLFMLNSAFLGNQEMVDYLIELGTDIHCRDDENNTPLHITSFNNAFSTAEVLLSHGANVNARNKTDNTPLHNATVFKRDRLVSLLLEHGADPNLRNKEGKTPIDIARDKYSQAVLEVFDEYFVNQGTTLHGAAKQGDTDKIKNHLKKGDSINERYGEKGYTPLHYAIKAGQTEAVQLLLEKGANPNMPTHVMSESNWRTVEETEKQVEGASNMRSIPLLMAIEKGKNEMVLALLEHQADINATCSQTGITALHLACSEGKSDIVKTLNTHGAAINATNGLGQTALQCAASSGYLDIVRFLIEQDADIDASDENGETPLNGAALSGHLDVVKFLLSQGADINGKVSSSIPDNSDMLMNVPPSPLYQAAFGGHTEIVEYLLKKGARVHPNIILAIQETFSELNWQRFMTPEWKEEKILKPEIIQLLKEHGAKEPDKD